MNKMDSETDLFLRCVAFAGSVAGLVFTIMRNHQASSFCWNSVAALLWIVLTFSKKKT